MKSLWAPWRIDYIKGEKEDGCIFCNKPKDDNDKKNLILYRGRTGYIIMNRSPSPAHVQADIIALGVERTQNIYTL